MMGSLLSGSDARFAPGLARAIVRANDDPDSLGRVRVEYPAFHGESGQTPSEWARLCLPYASAEHGFWSLPEVGDEVLVVFENGNLDQPIILGSLYSKKNKPPGAGRPGDKNADKKNTVTFVKTRTGHVLCFDDTDGKGMVVVKDRDGRKVELDGEKKTLTVSDGAGHQLVLDGQGKKVTLSDAGGNQVLLEDSAVTIKQKSGDTIKLKGGEVVIESSAKISLGEGAAHALIHGDTFMQLFNAHTHMVGPAGSTPPLSPMTPAMMSMKVKTV